MGGSLGCGVVALVVAGLASRGRIDDRGGGVVPGMVLWVGFPVVLWAGAILHEGTSIGGVIAPNGG